MDGKKEFLTEENYEKGKKKIMRIALIVFIVGVLLGGSLIITGIIKTNEVKKQNEQASQQVEQNSQTRTASDVQADIDSVQAKIDTLEIEIGNLKTEQNKIFRDDYGFSDRYYEKDAEIKAKQRELYKLESQLSNYKSELWKINSGYNDTQKEIEKAKNTISTSKYVPLYMFGVFIIVASCMITFSIYMFGKRREIIAFTAQQVMPVAQEGIEKMTPTVGNVAGSIARDITKGIKEGLKDDEKNK